MNGEEFTNERRRTITITKDELAEMLEAASTKGAEKGAEAAIKTIYANVGGSLVKKLAWLISIAVTLIGAFLINHFNTAPK